MNEFSVRPLSIDDADAVAALLLARDRADFGERGRTSMGGEWLREWWTVDDTPVEDGAWVAEADGEVVGFARVRPERDLANVADESAVHPEARGRGIGSRLLELAENWSRTRGLRACTSTSSPQKAARSPNSGATRSSGTSGGWRSTWRHRRHGLGLVLLRSSFRALWQNGQTRVGLEVDSDNESGATRLYERAGMHVTRRYATYEKRLD